MNARVRPAVFMPLFATTTVEGPADHGALIEQMKAAGMMAGAWMVEELVHSLKILEAKVEILDDYDLGEIKGNASELHHELGQLRQELKSLAETLVSDQDSEDQEDLYQALGRSAEVADSLEGEVGILEDNAFAIYDAIDI